MTIRKPLSKRLRFEIFKRDGFTCIYCGATPVQGKTLHVDHVVALANGGTDAPENLVTACDSCNLGKSSVPLEAKKHHAGPTTEAQLEHAEQIRAYLAVQRDIADAKRATVDTVADYWIERLGGIEHDMEARLPRLVEEFGVAKLLEAIDICARNPRLYSASQTAKYFHGILRNWREGR